MWDLWLKVLGKYILCSQLHMTMLQSDSVLDSYEEQEF